MTLDLPLAQQGATVALNLSLAVAVGACTAKLWTARLDSAWARLQSGRARRTALAALAMALIASACVLWLEAAAMAEVPVAQAGAATWSMLTATHLGLAWNIGTCVLVFSIAAMAFDGPLSHKRRYALLSLVGISAFLYTRSMVSHASADGDIGILMMSDWMHLNLACLWVGEVFVAGLVVLRAFPAGGRDDRADCARYLELLSASATVALAGIFATGLFNAWHHLGSPDALLGNRYGTTLMGKLALVIAAAMLGGFNRFFVLPALRAALRGADGEAGNSARRFSIVLRIEAGVLLGVLAVAAVLSATPPPTAG